MVLCFQNRIKNNCLSKDEMHGKLKRLQKNQCHQLKDLGKKDLSQSCLSFDPAAALLRAVNILDIPYSKRLASGPNYGAIFGQIFFSETLKPFI
jgi:hypothetical protein